MRFTPRQRLLQSAQFERVFKSANQRINEGPLRVLACQNQCSHPRLGIVVPKRVVRLAVARNRVKRVVRERFRLSQHLLPQLDIVVQVRSAVDASRLAQQVDRALTKLA